jgi:rod shape-determining protein MreC
LKIIETQPNRLKTICDALILLISLIVFSQQKDNYKKGTAFEQFLINFFAPIQNSITYAHGRAAGLFNNYLANINASKENKVLQKKVFFLEEKIFVYKELAKENVRLKELLQFDEGMAVKGVLAQVVGWDTSSDFKSLRINRGAKDGLKLQSTVVTSEGVVGYVYRMTDHFSDVLTLMNPKNRIDGIVERIRSHGIVEGFSGQRCIMKYVNQTDPLILNDIVLTSGLGNIYPKGLKIGTVSRIRRENYETMQYVEITPSVNFSRLEEVIVLVSKNKPTKTKEWNVLNSIKGNN